MGYAQLFQGIFMFPHPEAFQAALAAIESGQEAEDDADERETFRQAMVSDRVMVLHYDTYQPASMWFETKGRLFVLAEYAVRGFLVCAYHGDEVELEVIHANHKAIPGELPDGPVAPEEDFFPMHPGTRYDYETRFEGSVSSLWWTVREESSTRHGTYYSFPIEGRDFNFNDYLGGDEFISCGNRLFVPAQLSGHGSLDSLPDENLHLIADAGSPPGTAWVSHIPGTEAIRVYKHLGFEDVASPEQNYPACLKLQLNERILSTWDHDYTNDPQHGNTFSDHTSYLYFAKGVGLVKVGYPDGEIILKAFHRNTESAPPPPLRPTQETAPVTGSRASRKKPWWKFW